MAGSTNSNPPRPRKRVEAETASLERARDETASLKRARDGSAFTRCEECNKDVPVVLIDMHSCSLDSKIRMNLEAQVVEKETQIKKPERKRAAPSSENKERKSKKAKSNGDPNKPKRPPTAFFVFMDEFRKTYKETHPTSKGVTSVAKDGGEKWRSMSDEEKKVYIDRAAELKAEFEEAMEKYNAEKVEKNNEEDDEEEAVVEKGKEEEEVAIENEEDE